MRRRARPRWEISKFTQTDSRYVFSAVVPIRDFDFALCALGGTQSFEYARIFFGELISFERGMHSVEIFDGRRRGGVLLTLHRGRVVTRVGHTAEQFQCAITRLCNLSPRDGVHAIRASERGCINSKQREKGASTHPLIPPSRPTTLNNNDKREERKTFSRFTLPKNWFHVSCREPDETDLWHASGIPGKKRTHRHSSEAAVKLRWIARLLSRLARFVPVFSAWFFY